MTDDTKEYQETCNSRVYQMPDCKYRSRDLNYRTREKRDLEESQMRWFEEFVWTRNKCNWPKSVKEVAGILSFTAEVVTSLTSLTFNLLSGLVQFSVHVVFPCCHWSKRDPNCDGTFCWFIYNVV
jgi:hypothetical protein